MFVITVVVCVFFEKAESTRQISFRGGSKCLIQSKMHSSEYLKPANQFVQKYNRFINGINVYKTVCLVNLKDLDVIDKIEWRLEVADEKMDTFYMKKTVQGREEYLCSVISSFDFLTKSHELKRLEDSSKLDKKKCEWKIEQVASGKTDSLEYTIRNRAHSEPIVADELQSYPQSSHKKLKTIQRSVLLKHQKTFDLSDNYKWIIDCS
jgi:hypothetical protein